jgi:serine/threonine protein kinase
MREGRNYSEQAIRTIIKKLMSALSYIHKLNIIHRDIKLDNIVFVNKM